MPTGLRLVAFLTLRLAVLLALLVGATIYALTHGIPVAIGFATLGCAHLLIHQHLLEGAAKVATRGDSR